MDKDNKRTPPEKPKRPLTVEYIHNDGGIGLLIGVIIRYRNFTNIKCFKIRQKKGEPQVSQKITNGKLVDKQGKVYHQNVSGFLVSDHNTVHETIDYYLVFDEEEEISETKEFVKYGDNLEPLELICPPQTKLIGRPDLKKFNLNSLDHFYDQETKERSIVYTYLTHELPPKS